MSADTDKTGQLPESLRLARAIRSLLSGKAAFEDFQDDVSFLCGSGGAAGSLGEALRFAAAPQTAPQFAQNSAAALLSLIFGGTAGSGSSPELEKILELAKTMKNAFTGNETPKDPPRATGPVRTTFVDLKNMPDYKPRSSACASLGEGDMEELVELLKDFEETRDSEPPEQGGAQKPDPSG